MAEHPARQLLARVALDQFVFAPTFIAVFFTGTGLLKGQSLDDVKQTLCAQYKTAVLSNYTVWPWVWLVRRIADLLLLLISHNTHILR
jgi:protein Mpv17